MFEKQNLHQSLAILGVTEPGNLFIELSECYQSSSRHYHTDRHVSECLRHFSSYHHQAENPAEIEIAIWFHDAIYDTTKSDNEEQSADWAKRYLSQKAVDAQVIDRIVKMIIATKTHQSDSEDSALMVDIDLGILGASPAVFEEYDAAIRREFHWVPTVQYCMGRSQVLSSFLKRKAIYQTSTLFDLLEVQARENLSRKIKELATS